MGEIKPSFDTNRQILGQILPLDTPFTVIVDTSEACPFRCDYCFRSDPDKKNGEPLCNRRLPDMARYLKQNHVSGRVSIHTNAALLDEKYALDLAESGIDRIVVSLQGLTAEKYREVCGFPLDYEVFYRNLKILYEAKTNTQI